MMEETWGFDMGGVDPQDGPQDPPAGDYTMEITDINGPKTDKNKNLFIQPVCTILEAQDDGWVGKTYRPYMSLAETRVGITKGDLMRMGASAECLSASGNPRDLVGLVFNVSLVRRGEFLNMRNIEALGGPTEAAPAAAAAAPAPAPAANPQPEPRRRGVTRR